MFYSYHYFDLISNQKLVVNLSFGMCEFQTEIQAIYKVHLELIIINYNYIKKFYFLVELFKF